MMTGTTRSAGLRPERWRSAAVRPERRLVPALLAVLILAAASGPAHSQDGAAACDATLMGADFTGPSTDLARTADLLGPRSEHSFLIRRISDRMTVNACTAPRSVENLVRSLGLGPLPVRGAALLPIDSRLGFNSAYPRDWNDGVLWSGAGLGVSVTAGAAFRWGRFEAAVAPVVGFQQNSTFATHAFPDSASYSRYVDRWHGRFIDRPQRPGIRTAGIADLGQSYLRVATHGLRAGISHENLAWGPARRNPLLLSGTAPGFAHVFVESGRPHDIWIGDAEAQLFWGRLTESDHFDFDPDNDHRALAGTIVTLRPRGLDGLHLGAGHLMMQTWNDATSFSDLIVGPYGGLGADSSGLPRDLRLFALFMRWAAAPDGFEIYGEWARQDSWQQWFRVSNRVEAAQAYTLGVQQTVRRGSNAVRLSAEVSHLSDAVAHRSLGRGIQTFYASAHVPQGHTHRGQLLGAPIGPGSEAQFIGADVFWGLGRSSFSIERVRYDDDAYYAVWSQNHGPHGHDTELSFRAGHLIAQPSFSVDAELGYSFRYSRSLLGLHHVNTVDFPYRRDTNYQLRISARWHPPVPSWEAR